MPASAPSSPDQDVQHRLGRRLATLRTERGWSLDTLAERTGISRATLSRIERGELSPTAAMLGRLCSAYGWTLSRLIAEAETPAASLISAQDQIEWTDPESRYRRRIVSPPAPALRGELVEVHVPAGATVTFDTSPVPALEHHLWMIEGALTLDVEGSVFNLRPGDCLRYVLNGPTRFQAAGRRGARYLVAVVRP
jgi:transcriptional regulator with XRE-family HTH domain